MHAAGRYRLIGLTPPQARELARALARTADMLTALARDRASSRTSQQAVERDAAKAEI